MSGNFSPRGAIRSATVSLGHDSLQRYSKFFHFIRFGHAQSAPFKIGWKRTTYSNTSVFHVFLDLLNMYFVEVKNMSLETKNKPESVVENLENHPEVDIVLSDIMMPGVDGWKLIEKIKARFPLLTVIFYCSDPNAFKQKPDSAPAPDHFLQKPFKMEHLLEIINTIGRQKL